MLDITWQKGKQLITHPRFSTFSSAFLILLYLVFIYNHVKAVRDGIVTPTVIVFLIMESIVIWLLLARSKPLVQETSALAWFFALSGTFLPLLLIPSGEAIHQPLGSALMVAGGMLASVAYLSLNTSFGISPALRKVKTSGLYKIVRHPMYLSYLVIYSGYILSAFSITNAIFCATLVFCLIMRIHFEEKLLMQSESYRQYSRKVTTRLIPFVY